MQPDRSLGDRAACAINNNTGSGLKLLHRLRGRRTVSTVCLVEGLSHEMSHPQRRRDAVLFEQPVARPDSLKIVVLWACGAIYLIMSVVFIVMKLPPVTSLYVLRIVLKNPHPASPKYRTLIISIAWQRGRH
jgi:hypothetical protein